MEHLFALQSGTTFKAHRGEFFIKVVQVTTNSQISLGIKIQENSECELTVGDMEIPVISENWRTLRIMWLNVAITNLDTPGQPPMDLQRYLQPIVQNHMPDALLVTSTGHGFHGALLLSNIMKSIGYTIGYQNTVGLDHGVVCVAYQGYGGMWRNVDHGNSLENGVVVEYNWF